MYYLFLFIAEKWFVYLIIMQLEIKMVGGFNTLALKQQFGKKLMELENEKWIVQV